MADKITNKDRLLDAILEGKGLSFITSYLTESLDKPLIITDNSGKIYATKNCKGISSSYGEQHVIIPLFSIKIKYFYDNQKRCLYFRAGENHRNGAFIVLLNLDNNEISKVIPYLEEARTAIRVYFSQLYTAETVEKDLRSQLVEDLLFNNTYNIKEIIKKSTQAQGLDINQLYYIAILEPEIDTDIDFLYADTKKWLKVNKLDIICSIWNNSITFICPTHFKDKTFEIDYGWKKHLRNIRRHKKYITERLNIPCSFGIGQKYPLTELHRSYREAKTALNLSRLMGDKDFVKHYLDMGVFTLLFQQDLDTLKNFCHKSLGKLIEFDRTNKGELLTTLRHLLDFNMDWKKTANSLFIHVNTLRYRTRKIEELLNIDLNKIETVTNLFVALKVYDSLTMNGFWEEKN